MRALFIIILVAIIAAAVAFELIADAIRKKDFNDQVSGKKPERKGPVKETYNKSPKENSQITIDREILRTKSGQNLFGPK